MKKFILLAIAAITAWYPVATLCAAASRVFDLLTTPQPRLWGQVNGVNTLTALIPDLYQSMDSVAREMAGMIPAVTLNANSDRAAVGSKVRSFVAPAAASENATPAQLPPDTGAQVIGTNYLTITKSKVVPFQWTGEEQMQVAPGHGYRAIAQDQVSQAIRTLVNEIETDLWLQAVKNSSRAAGAAGTKVFNSGLGDAALVRRVLADNGAPMNANDMNLVLGTWEGVSLRSQATIPNMADAGSVSLREQGILLPMSGFRVRESAAVTTRVIGTTTATVNASAYAVGATVLTLSVAANAMVDGDLFTLAGDSNIYAAVAGGTYGSGGTVVIGAPGLRKAIAGAASPAITVIAIANRNIAFHRSAIQLALRAPAVPEEGDSADDRTVLTDPRTGISFEFAMYKQYRRVRYEVGAAWGQEVMKQDFCAQLIGLTG